VSKLLERLSDPAKSGVYRVAHDRDVRDALSASAHDLVAVTLAPGKAAMLAAIARALAFPEWFGGNWDALEDCLADLSWRRAAARVILLADAAPGDDLGILQDVLAAAAGYWRERGQGFFAIFIDPAGKLALPALYKEKVKRADG
jgi:hypothetical protein